MDETSTFDVVVVGSGAGGMVAALAARERGLSVLVIEKSDRYGGTSAVSGGAIWFPVNGASKDTRETALAYLKAVTRGAVPEAKLARYVDTGPEVLEFLKRHDVHYYVHPMLSYPDYHQGATDALPRGRTLFAKPVDGQLLGEEFFALRETYPELKLFSHISIDIPESAVVGGKAPGWKRMLARILASYWLDRRWRKRTHRDRRLTLGNALVGGLRAAMLQKGIPLWLDSRMTSLRICDGQIRGVTLEHQGRERVVVATRGVILACGGFEQSQALREKYFEQATSARWSATPRDNNTGDGLLAALAVGADVEFMGEAWWAPTVPTPSKQAPNVVRNISLFYERGFPHSIMVNRLGQRFTNEAASYHQVGQGMLRDNAATRSNLPCWIVFDATFRKRYPLGPLLPGSLAPDSKLPPGWIDSFLFRAASLDALATKIGVDPSALAQTVQRFNRFAADGVDADFGRGGNPYDLYFGDPTHAPSPVLGALETAPFYALRVDLGDLGSKGGLKTDEHARVLDRGGRPIPGLYATGNVSGSVMGEAYPGAGATLGAATAFALAAVRDIAEPVR